ncbi:ABC transporter permease [Glycomyces salinus]|uniref:ABC transporter permease n=1 Tax=Glycomyces salinus TaxID=980294 RepID=UPI001E5D82DB|nr:ABC transporter permease [Glycomyces salinus]
MARFQIAAMRRSPHDLMALVNAPLFTVIFLAIVRYTGRDDLTGYAVLAPAMITVFAMALLASGEIIANDRTDGRLELLVASPSPVAVVVLSRIAMITLVSLVSVAECWLVARVLFGKAVAVPHPWLFVGTLAAIGLAMAGTASAMAGLFVLTRSARTFQNSLSYPFYILGGVLVPPALLPEWLRPLTQVVFLSWGTDLLRDSLSEAPVQRVLPRIAAVIVLGGTGFLLGAWLIHRVLLKVRNDGTVSHA